MTNKKKLLGINPVTIALQARDYRDTLINTRLSDEYALQAVANGTHTTTDLQRLAYMLSMTTKLARVGFAQVGVTDAELTAQAKQALQSLDIGQLRYFSDLHQAQLDVCTPTQYLRARQTL